MEENRTLPGRRPPTPYHIWDGGEWLLPETVRETARYWAAAEKWEEIKQKRHDNLRGGVYVESVGKWFHSTDEARQFHNRPVGRHKRLLEQSSEPWNYDYSGGWMKIYQEGL